MSITRRSFLRRSAAAAVAVPFLEHISVDFCDASPRDVVDYTMGYPPNAARLNLNENPFGPSPLALDAIQPGLAEANRYVSRPTQLRKALAELHGVEDKNLVLGSGSGEILKAVALAYLRDSGNMVSTVETFRTTPAMAETMGAKVKWIRLRPDWSYDIEALLGAVDSETKIFYLVNPNNPTGGSVSFDTVRSIADALPKSVLFFIDEAYVHFLPDSGRSGVDLLKQGYSNVFVTRTFSKVYGLAGLRIGYGVGDPEAIKKISFYVMTMINIAGYYGAIAALGDQEHVKKFVNHAKHCRSFFEKELTALGRPYVIGVSPLVMIDVGEDSKQFEEKMAKENVFVRRGEDWDMPKHIRISYGSEEANRAAIAALKKLLT